MRIVLIRICSRKTDVRIIASLHLHNRRYFVGLLSCNALILAHCAADSGTCLHASSDRSRRSLKVRQPPLASPCPLFPQQLCSQHLIRDLTAALFTCSVSQRACRSSLQSSSRWKLHSLNTADVIPPTTTALLHCPPFSPDPDTLCPSVCSPSPMTAIP